MSLLLPLTGFAKPSRGYNKRSDLPSDVVTRFAGPAGLALSRKQAPWRFVRKYVVYMRSMRA
jgi:hypothetical protein